MNQRERTTDGPHGELVSNVNLVDRHSAAGYASGGAGQCVRVDVVSAHEEATLLLHAKQRHVRIGCLLARSGAASRTTATMRPTQRDGLSMVLRS
jgi:hypothetical protein